MFIALGSSVADPLAAVSLAARAVVARLDLRDADCSSLWRTPPAESASGGWFVNGVVSGRSSASPLAVLATLQELEQAFGRNRAAEGFHGARPLDLDLLSIEGVLLDVPALVLPHPRLQQRPFVLGPLAELAPDWQHPRLARSAAALWQALLDADPRHGCDILAPSPLEPM